MIYLLQCRQCHLVASFCTILKSVRVGMFVKELTQWVSNSFKQHIFEACKFFSNVLASNMANKLGSLLYFEIFVRCSLRIDGIQSCRMSWFH